jgi:carbonic anhydrase
VIQEHHLEGNGSYVAGKMKPNDFISERPSLTLGQNLFAGILGCADSRVGQEYAFDVGRRDVLSAAAPAISPTSIRSPASNTPSQLLGTPLTLVLGHDKCGAVDAAVKAVRDG